MRDIVEVWFRRDNEDLYMELPEQGVIYDLPVSEESVAVHKGRHYDELSVICRDQTFLDRIQDVSTNQLSFLNVLIQQGFMDDARKYIVKLYHNTAFDVDDKKAYLVQRDQNIGLFVPGLCMIEGFSGDENRTEGLLRQLACAEQEKFALYQQQHIHYPQKSMLAMGTISISSLDSLLTNIRSENDCKVRIEIPCMRMEITYDSLI